MILGLDLSSSVCGWCLIKEDGTFYKIGYLDLKKEKNLYSKLSIMKNFIKSLEEIGDVEKIFIEEPVMAFSSSTAYVISLLQRWNGMVSAMINIVTKKEPILVSSSHARKINNIKLIKGENTKLQVFHQVKSLDIIPEDTWQYKKTGNPKDFCFDMCDAFVVAMAGYKDESEKANITKET